jgi:hypothetical protein
MQLHADDGRARSRRLSLGLRERLCSPARTPRCRSSSAATARSRLALPSATLMREPAVTSDLTTAKIVSASQEEGDSVERTRPAPSLGDPVFTIPTLRRAPDARSASVSWLLKQGWLDEEPGGQPRRDHRGGLVRDAMAPRITSSSKAVTTRARADRVGGTDGVGIVTLGATVLGLSELGDISVDQIRAISRICEHLGKLGGTFQGAGGGPAAYICAL